MVILTEVQGERAATPYLYDVFLSFRGEDTRFSFVDHLTHALIKENILTYVDGEGVKTGEEDLKPDLARAIKSSRASIIVLSKNYASSTWCLDELVMILEQKRNSNQTVLPIFYHVDRDYVRKQRDSYRRRMKAENDRDEKSQRAHKLEMWVKALTDVSNLKGMDAKGL